MEPMGRGVFRTRAFEFLLGPFGSVCSAPRSWEFRALGAGVDMLFLGSVQSSSGVCPAIPQAINY